MKVSELNMTQFMHMLNNMVDTSGESNRVWIHVPPAASGYKNDYRRDVDVSIVLGLTRKDLIEAARGESVPPSFLQAATCPDLTRPVSNLSGDLAAQMDPSEWIQIERMHLSEYRTSDGREVREQIYLGTMFRSNATTQSGEPVQEITVHPSGRREVETQHWETDHPYATVRPG